MENKLYVNGQLKKELTELQTQIDNTDKEIVYALYGLSEDEVAIVENG